MVRTTRKKAKPVFKKFNGTNKEKTLSKELNKRLRLLEKKEKEIKKAEADIKATRIFLAQKENLLQKKHAELKEKEEVFSNIDLDNISEEEFMKTMDGKVSSKFIRDVVLKNIEMSKKEKELHQQISELKSREDALQAEIDNVLKIVEEVQK